MIRRSWPDIVSSYIEHVGASRTISVLVAALCSMPSGRRAVHTDVEVGPYVIAAAEGAVRASVHPVDLGADSVDDEDVTGERVVRDILGIVAEGQRADETPDVVRRAVLLVRTGPHECDAVGVVVGYEQHAVRGSVRETRWLVRERGGGAGADERTRPGRFEEVGPLIDGHLLDLGISDDQLVGLGNVRDPRGVGSGRRPRERIDRLHELCRLRCQCERRRRGERHLDDSAVGRARPGIDDVQAEA